MSSKKCEKIIILRENMAENELFHKRLKDFREKQGYSQKQLADILNIPQKSLSNYETGRTEPSLNILKKLDALGCSFNYLVYEDHDIKAKENIKENFIEETAKNDIPLLLEEPAAQERIGKDMSLIKVINSDMKSKTVIQLPNELKDYEGKLIAIIQKGDDMETTIKTNSIVLCDTEGFQGQGVYVIKINNTYMVKRIALKPDYYIIYSDNKLYEPFEINIDNEKLKIGGKVRIVANIFY